MDTQRSFLKRTLAAALLILPAWYALPQDTETDREFHLQANGRETVVLELAGPGEIEVVVEWFGSAGTLSVFLNGPGQEEPFVTKQGSAPLMMKYVVNEERLKGGPSWKITLVNPGSGSAQGTLHVRAPAPPASREQPPPTTKIQPVERTAFRADLEGRLSRFAPQHRIAPIVVPLFFQHLEETAQEPGLAGQIHEGQFKAMVSGWQNLSSDQKSRLFHPRYARLQPGQKVDPLQLGRDILRITRPDFENEIRTTLRKAFGAGLPKFRWTPGLHLPPVRRELLSRFRALPPAEQRRQMDALMAQVRSAPEKVTQDQLAAFPLGERFSAPTVRQSPLFATLTGKLPSHFMIDLNAEHVARNDYAYRVELDYFYCEDKNETTDDDPYWNIFACLPQFNPNDAEYFWRMGSHGDLADLPGRVTHSYDVQAHSTKSFSPQDRLVFSENTYGAATTFTIGLWEEDWAKDQVREALSSKLRQARGETANQVRDAVLDAVGDAVLGTMLELFPEVAQSLRAFFNGQISFDVLMVKVDATYGGVDASWLFLRWFFGTESIAEIVTSMAGMSQVWLVITAIKVGVPMLLDLFGGEFAKVFRDLVFLPYTLLKEIYKVFKALIDFFSAMMAIIDPDDHIQTLTVRIDSSGADVFKDADWGLGPQNFVQIRESESERHRALTGRGPYLGNSSLRRDGFYFEPVLKFKGADAEYYAYYNVKRDLQGGKEIFGYTVKPGQGRNIQERTFKAKHPRPGQKIRITVMCVNAENVVPIVNVQGVRSGISASNLASEDPSEFTIESVSGEDYTLTIASILNMGELSGYVAVDENMAPVDGCQLYVDRNYAGYSVRLFRDVERLEDYGLNDNVSSLRATPRFPVTLFSGSQFKGGEQTFLHPVPYLGGTTVGNDQASSLRIRRAEP